MKPFISSASTTLPQDSTGKKPNSMRGFQITETAGAAARVKLRNRSIAKPGACVGAENVAAGAITVGDHIFKLTSVTAQGETEAGSVSNTVAAAGARKIDLTSIPVYSGEGADLVTGRNIYMTEAGGATYYKVDSGAATVPTIADNTTTTLTVSLSDATLAGYVAAPSENTSGVLVADVRLASTQTYEQNFSEPVSAYLLRAEIVSGTAPQTIIYGE